MPSNLNMWTVGDSNTNGLPATPSSYRQALLALFPSITYIGTLTDSAGFLHDGHNGFCYSFGCGLGPISSIPTMVSDITVLWAGTNDIAQGFPVSSAYANFVSYANSCKSLTNKLIVLEPVMPKPYTSNSAVSSQPHKISSDYREFSCLIARWCADNGARYISVSDSNPTYSGDGYGVHLDAPSLTIIANLIYTEIITP